MDNDELRTVNVYLAGDMRRWLDAEAKRQDRPLSRIIRQALEMYRSTLDLARSDASCDEEVKAVQG